MGIPLSAMQRLRPFVGDSFRVANFSFRTEAVRDMRCGGKALFSYLNEVSIYDTLVVRTTESARLPQHTG
jgi:hypothetical protein